MYKFNSASFACANAERPSHNAAMYLFKTMLNYDITPTIVTFANLAQAHVKASLEQIQRIRADMKEYDVPSHEVFAESYLMQTCLSVRNDCEKLRAHCVRKSKSM